MYQQQKKKQALFKIQVYVYDKKNVKLWGL